MKRNSWKLVVAAAVLCAVSFAVMASWYGGDEGGKCCDPTPSPQSNQ